MDNTDSPIPFDEQLDKIMSTFPKPNSKLNSIDDASPPNEQEYPSLQTPAPEFHTNGNDHEPDDSTKSSLRSLRHTTDIQSSTSGTNKPISTTTKPRLLLDIASSSASKGDENDNTPIHDDEQHPATTIDEPQPIDTTITVNITTTDDDPISNQTRKPEQPKSPTRRNTTKRNNARNKTPAKMKVPASNTRNKNVYKRKRGIVKEDETNETCKKKRGRPKKIKVNLLPLNTNETTRENTKKLFIDNLKTMTFDEFKNNLDETLSNCKKYLFYEKTMRYERCYFYTL